MKIKTLTEKYNILFPGRLAIRLSHAQKCFFVPWYYIEEKNIWVGENRWWGNNRRSIKVGQRINSPGSYTFFRKVPILPFKHPVRKRLEREMHFNKYKNELLGNQKTMK